MRLEEKIFRTIASVKTFERGEVYFKKGHVHEREIRGDVIAAKVIGNAMEDYEVEINLSDPADFSCTCSIDSKHQFSKGILPSTAEF